jgi:hypothetical protein
MLAPALVAEPPPGWVEAAIERCPLGEAADATFTSFQSWRAADASGGLVTACVAAPVPGWVEEMRPAVEGRGAALIGASAERITTVPMDLRPEAGRYVLRAAGRAEGSAPLGSAQRYLGFDDGGHVVTCFVVCAATTPAGPLPAACDEVVAKARFREGAAPPPPGLALGALTWAVHHPAGTASGAAALVTCAAVLAVAGRRRPRTRIQGGS